MSIKYPYPVFSTLSSALYSVHSASTCSTCADCHWYGFAFPEPDSQFCTLYNYTAVSITHQSVFVQTVTDMAQNALGMPASGPLSPSRLKTTHIRSSLPYRSQVSAWVAFLTFSHPWLCVCIGDHTSHTLTKLKTTLIQQCWSSVSPGYRMGHTFYTFYTVYTIQAFHKCFTFTLFAFSFCWFFISNLVYINWNQICQTSQVTKYILILNEKLSNVFCFVSIKVFHSHTSICNCHVLLLYNVQEFFQFSFNLDVLISAHREHW